MIHREHYPIGGNDFWARLVWSTGCSDDASVSTQARLLEPTCFKIRDRADGGVCALRFNLAISNLQIPNV
jgi:hypothetical protein